MKRKSKIKLCLVWIVLLVGLVAACQPTPGGLPSESAPVMPAPTRTLPPPAQTRTARSALSLTPTPVPSPTPTPVTSRLAVQPEALRGVQVQFWHTATGEANAILQALAAAFNRSNTWGITVEPVSHAGLGDLEEQVYLAQSEKRLPGLIAAYTDQALRWEASKSMLADLTPYVTDPVWGLSSTEQQDFYPGFWAQDLVVRASGSPRSKRLGVPWYRSALLVIYNRTWAEELGFRTLPDTPDQFRQQVCTAAQTYASDAETVKDGTGGWLITSNPLMLPGWMRAFGSTWEAQGEFTFHTPAAEEAVQYLADLVTDGCAWSTTGETAAEAFAARRTLAYMGSLTSLPLQQLLMQQTASEDQWVVLPFPSTTGNQSIEAYGPGLVVVESQPAQELAAWLFARWLLSPEIQASWAVANGVFPVRASALQQPRDSAELPQQWQQALVWLPKARSEPALASWGVMRGVMVDALDQVVLPGFQGHQAASLLVKLDQIAAEVQAQSR